MADPVLGVSVTGVRTTLVAVSAELFGLSVRATAGLIAAAKVIQEKARGNVEPFRYEGRLHDAIQVRTHVKSPVYVSVTVGIHGDTFAPEGKTFEVGWHSKKGLQPPTGPITEWVLRRGFGDEKSAKHIAYVIARHQGRMGYSFGERHWMSEAWDGEAAVVEATVVRYAAASWAGQTRAPSGRWLSG